MGPKTFIGKSKNCKTTSCHTSNGCYDCAKRSSPTNTNNSNQEILFTNNTAIIDQQSRQRIPIGLNKPCKFPFVYRGRTFLGCTNWCPDPCENLKNYCKPNYWCATEVDSDRYMIEWGWCDIDPISYCPICKNPHCTDWWNGNFCKEPWFLIWIVMWNTLDSLGCKQKSCIFFSQ